MKISKKLIILLASMTLFLGIITPVVLAINNVENISIAQSDIDCTTSDDIISE